MRGSKSGLKQEQISKIAERLVPTIIYNLLQEGQLDRDRLSDDAYVLSRVVGCDDDTMGRARLILDHHFIEYARDAIAAQDMLVAVVLLATAIEHRLNRFYMKALETRLQDRTINEILRNSIHAKLGWLMSLVTTNALPDALKSRIKRVVDVRNAIVHYKHPAFEWDSLIDERQPAHLVKQLEALDSEDILSIPDELEEELENMLEEIDPDIKLARQVFERIDKKAG